MRFLDQTLPSPEENLVLDDTLLNESEKDGRGEALRLWEPETPFVVLGRTCDPDEDVHLEAARRDRIPVLRRTSGGGTVLQGKGCLNYTLVLSKVRRPELNDLRRSYRVILDEIIGVLKLLDISVEFRPVSDLVLPDGERKVSGNAQRRARTHILQHGTILYDFDFNLVERYLKIPVKVPDYRKGRGHLDFLANIPSGGGEIKKAFRKYFKISV